VGGAPLGSRLLGEPTIMGMTAENLAGKYGISREDQDRLALESHQKAEAAIKAGRFVEEIIPIEIPGKPGERAPFAQDEHPRFGLKLEDLVKLRPAFKKNGTVTPGNSSGLNDGAAAAIITSRKRARELGLRPMARVVAQAVCGVEPQFMGYGPVPATAKVLAKARMTLGDLQLIGLNEAFAAQYIACERGLGLDRFITNVNGSGIGLGHPVDAPGYGSCFPHLRDGPPQPRCRSRDPLRRRRHGHGHDCGEGLRRLRRPAYGLMCRGVRMRRAGLRTGPMLRVTDAGAEGRALRSCSVGGYSEAWAGSTVVIHHFPLII